MLQEYNNKFNFELDTWTFMNNLVWNGEVYKNLEEEASNTYLISHIPLSFTFTFFLKMNLSNISPPLFFQDEDLPGHKHCNN